MGRRKKWIIAAVVVLIIGVIVCGITFAVSGFDLNTLSNVKYETNTYEINEGFRNISITTDVDKIVFIPSQNDRCTVVCNEKEDALHDVQMKDNTLTINVQDNHKWYNFISFGIQEPSVTVYLPGSEYDSLMISAGTGNVEVPGDFSFRDISVDLTTGNVTCNASAETLLSIKAGTGDIRAEGLSAGEISLGVTTGHINASSIDCDGSVDVHVSTGEAVLQDVSCRDLNSTGSTGGLTMKNVIASGDMHVERSTGDIRFEGCDAGSIYAKTSTGDVRGTLLSEKIFITDTGTGNVDVPKTVQGGTCEIITGTGDINIQIQ